MNRRDPDDSEGWRRKYYDSLGTIDSTEQRLAEIENLLYASVSRLAHGAYGLSESLDRELDRLRAAVKGRSDPEQISELALHVQECGRDVPAARALLRLVDDLELPKAQRRSLARVRGALKQVVDESELGEVHSQLASLLNASLGAVGAGSPQDADASGDEASLPAEHEQKLTLLLEWLPLSEVLRGEAETLRGQLGKMNTAAAIEAAAEIVRSLREEVERERSEMQSYLEDLDMRLRGLGEVMSDQASERLAATQLRERLDVQIGDEVDGMHRAVFEAVDVEPLRQAVNERLARIKSGMASFVASESERRGRVERSEARALERLEHIELESAQLHERLEDMRDVASRDALTGCFNRGAFDARVTEEYARWLEQPGPLALLIWDVDRFKAVNDTYGHPVGDKVLKAVAEVLQQAIRTDDHLARYGGEEFVLLLPGTPLGQAEKLAQVLRERIAGTRFVYQGQRVEVTASCGVAEFSAGDSPESVLERADRALYRAKAAGRNRVEIGRA